MCGIAGILTESQDSAELAAACRRMTDAMTHRGPDDSGVECLSLPGGLQLCLGHRRLSILDLSRRARQPMQDPGTGSWVVFNGEIYNHQALRRQLDPTDFRSSSDTETLLLGWVQFGPEWIRQLRGIFAFALYDAGRGQLWLARDHVGVKPLYLANPRPKLWLFASEVRALLASGMVERKMSGQGLVSYLAFGAVQSPATLVQGVTSLLPAEQVCFDLNAPADRIEPRSGRYWSLDFSAAGRRASTTRLRPDDFQRLCEVWETAVRGQLLSDVPVGVFLSGGIDSSAIAVTLARLGTLPSTFSVVFRESAFDESRYSRMVAETCRSEHHELVLTPEDVLRQVDRALASYDQPSIDGVNTYFLSQAVRQAGIKVALSGLGGDEVFAGYPSFRRMPRLERLFACVPSVILRLSVSLARLGRQTVRGIKLWQLLESDHSRLAIYSVLRQLYPPSLRRQLTAASLDRLPELAPSLEAELAKRAQATDAINATSLLEISLYMHNMLLRDTDQMSMAHALEVRVPLLDHLLIEEVCRLPGAMKLSRGRRPNKWLLVRLAGEMLTSQVVQRPKRGFTFPWECWLRRELRPRVEDVLLDKPSLQDAGLDPAAVARLWDDYLRHKAGLRYSDVLGVWHYVQWIRTHRLIAA